MQSFRSFTRCACLQHLLFQFPKSGIREACIAKTVTICHLPTLILFCAFCRNSCPLFSTSLRSDFLWNPICTVAGSEARRAGPRSVGGRKAAAKSASRSGGRAHGTHWSTGVRRRSRRMRPCLRLRGATGNSQTSSKIARRLWQHEDGDLQPVGGARRFQSWLGEWRDVADYRLPLGSLSRILHHGHHYIVQRRSGFTIASSCEGCYDV